MTATASSFLNSENSIRLLTLLLVGTWLILASTGVAGAEPDELPPYNLVSDLQGTLEESLKAEQTNLAEYDQRLALAQKEQIYFNAAIKGYQLRLSTYGNLLLSAGVDISLLQKTRTEFKSVLVDVQKMEEEISPVGAALELERNNLAQQKQLIDKQKAELARINSEVKKNAITRTLEKKATQLYGIIKKKEQLMAKLHRIYRDRQEHLATIKQSFIALETRFDAAIEERKARELFERKKDLFQFDVFKALRSEIQLFFQNISVFFGQEFWIKWGQKFWQSAGFVAISLVFVISVALVMLVRIKAPVAAMGSLGVVQQLGAWHQMASELLSLSVIPGGMALTLFLYSRLDAMFLLLPVLQTAVILTLVYLVVRCAERAFSSAAVTAWEPHAAPLMKLCRMTGIFLVFYTPIYHIQGADSRLLVIFRMAGASFILVWTLITWRELKFAGLGAEKDPEARRGMGVGLAIKTLLVAISGVALGLDMIGYGSLCVYWLLSWGKTLVILFLGWVIWSLIREWDLYYRAKNRKERNEFLYDNYPVQWLMIRAGQFFWLISFLVLLLLIWGRNQQSLVGRIYEALAHPLAVGNMTFSLIGVIYAALVLLITYGLTRVWKWLFQSKFLSQSGMALGLQDSITTITVYVIWMLGILISLHVFGLNTASLAVAFGALGIGLGFGLQNIFNNFISGIILLFERPIQVGDDVELNGVWGQVKKINVRSTVVQTYDNASLIIPNADFISNQVINWSFKDKRIRRNINVGVAYGSNVELVRETLVEIAASTPKVLGYPRPDVLFRDFGDSALIFRLRIWTDIDNMLTVETNIRCEIDRLFRERNIEISFPQRDLHIRTIADGWKKQEIIADLPGGQEAS